MQAAFRRRLVVLPLAGMLISACGYGGSGGAGGAGTGAGQDGLSPVASSAKPPRNILIYLVDTLRADRMSLYGYGRATTPKTDRFAASGVVFDAAYSSSPWTRTSVVTMFTGLHPDAHGVHDHEDAVPDALDLMAEVLDREGYETAAFTTNISVSEKFNLQQGFDTLKFYGHEEYFADRDEFDPGYVPVHGMFPDVAAWLETPRDRPFFLYVHPTDPHLTYSPPDAYRLWSKKEKADVYDAEVLYSDDFFGRTLDILREMNILDDTLVILTSDHGEELKERFVYGHGHTLYNELMRVPLVMRHPSLTPGRRTETVRLLDFYPTIAELMDLPVDRSKMQGRSFLPLLRGQSLGDEPKRPVFGQVKIPKKIVGASLQADGKKIIRIEWNKWGRQAPWQLYDIEEDPAEKNDLAKSDPDLLAEYRKRLEAIEKLAARGALPSEPVVLDPATEDTLRTLGYID